MRRSGMLAGAVAVAIASAAALPAQAQEAPPVPPPTQTVELLYGTVALPMLPTDDFVIPAPPALVIEAPPPTPKTGPPANVPIPTTPPPSVAFQEYVRMLHSLSPEALIRHVWRDKPRDGERMVQIARRESGLNCAAANRRSSARGLFQHLSSHAARAQRMGMSWADVPGPDCVTDVLLARAMWNESGYQPWSLTA